MVRYLLGWTSESESDEDDNRVPMSDQDLCHPLCQCYKCQPVQRRQSLSGNRDLLNVHSCNHDGLTSLHVAALHGQCNVANLLIKKGAEVNVRNKSMEASPLHVACQYNKPKMVKLLLQHGARVNQRDARANVPLHFCAMNGCVEAASVLLQNGAQVEPQNSKGDTPMHESARWNMIDMVKLLLRHGAKVRLRNKAQLTPIQLAQNEDVVELLEQAVSDELASDMLEPSTGGKSPDGSDTPTPGSQTHPESREPSIDALFAAFEDNDLHRLREITDCIRTFDRRSSLRSTLTRDRSAPRLDWLLKHQMAITNFDVNRLRRASTDDRSAPHIADNVSELSAQKLHDLVPVLREMNDLKKDESTPPLVAHLQTKLDLLHEECENSNTESADEMTCP